MAYYESLNEQLPIFHKSFYLDAVCGENWNYAIHKKGDRIIATMPYSIKIEKGYRNLIMPPLCQFLGPHFHHKVDRPKEYEKVITSLFSQLPKFDFYEQNWNPILNNWWPLYLDDYQQTSFYSYYIDHTTFQDNWLSTWNSNAKRNLKKGKHLQISFSEDFELFFSILESNFSRNTRINPFKKDQFQRIEMGCKLNGARKIVLATTEDGKVIGGLYLIFDSKTVYYLSGGFISQFQSHGVIHRLMSFAINFAMKNGKNFDFEGSMIPSIANFFQSLGGTPRSYMHITKIVSKKLSIKTKLKNLLEEIKS